jgi:ribosomal protein S5
VKQYKSTPGKSLNESIKSMAKRDESFNEFLKNFKTKNEQGWANIIDLTQEEQERRLLEKTPDQRKNEMVMMEEFRRRKNLQRYFDQMKKQKAAESTAMGDRDPVIDMEDEAINRESQFKHSGPERYFTPGKDDIFNPAEFTLIFIDSDSVTNVTALNRVNARRVLLFIGNSNGVISYAMGKGEDYEAAFETAFKKLRANLICIPLDQLMTVPQVLKARHNDFRITIYPQMQPNYWGHPVVWKMLIHTGFFHCRFWVKSRKRDPYSMIYAFFQAVTKNRTQDELAQITGRKITQISYGNPTTNTTNMHANFF